MIGRGAGLVVESRHPQFRSGERVQGEFGWREHAVLDGRPVDGLVPGRPAQIQRDGRSGLGGGPGALINMLSGGNIGKQAVRLAAAIQ